MKNCNSPKCPGPKTRAHELSSQFPKGCEFYSHFSFGLGQKQEKQISKIHKIISSTKNSWLNQ